MKTPLKEIVHQLTRGVWSVGLGLVFSGGTWIDRGDGGDRYQLPEFEALILPSTSSPFKLLRGSISVVSIINICT